ncbi:malonic semialdehyde reductase RutE [mine drainage metagenome]|uniref:Malonic semialdehyde reductase RutE n=1 Tax=mine drainage metagenome TaxID=410659 RepID=A0A1J5REN9_9ZZZZ
MQTESSRQAEFPVDPLFLNRWSPRAFTGEPLPDAVLFTLFEAARWAPSSYNGQPWRFCYAKRGGARWGDFLACLHEVNRQWAEQASALVFLAASQSIQAMGQTIPAPAPALDCGAAWASLALQASLLGWHAHAIGGFDRTAAARVVGMPKGYDMLLAVAIGRRGGKESLPEALQAREAPTPRRPLAELVAEGCFPRA